MAGPEKFLKIVFKEDAGVVACEKVWSALEKMRQDEICGYVIEGSGRLRNFFEGVGGVYEESEDSHGNRNFEWTPPIESRLYDLGKKTRYDHYLLCSKSGKELIFSIRNSCMLGRIDDLPGVLIDKWRKKIL